MVASKNPLVTPREISALVGISVAMHAQGLETIIEDISQNPEHKKKYHKNAEVKYDVPGILVRSKLLWKLGIEKVEYDEPGIPLDISDVTSTKRLKEVLNYFGLSGYERATAVTNTGKLIPHVKIETGDLRNGGIIKVLLEQMTGALFERAHLSKKYAVPRKYQKMKDIYEEQIPQFTQDMIMSTKGEAAHICGVLAAHFPRYFMLSQMNHDEIDVRMHYPNIISPISFHKGSKERFLFNKGEAVILNAMTLRNAIDKYPPSGTTQIFYAQGDGKRTFSTIRFEYLTAEKKLLEGIPKDQHDETLFTQYENRDIVCVFRHFSTELRGKPKQLYQKIITPELIQPYQN